MGLHNNLEEPVELKFSVSMEFLHQPEFTGILITGGSPEEPASENYFVIRNKIMKFKEALKYDLNHEFEGGVDVVITGAKSGSLTLFYSVVGVYVFLSRFKNFSDSIQLIMKNSQRIVENVFSDFGVYGIRVSRDIDSVGSGRRQVSFPTVKNEERKIAPSNIILLATQACMMAAILLFLCLNYRGDEINSKTSININALELSRHEEVLRELSYLKIIANNINEEVKNDRRAGFIVKSGNDQMERMSLAIAALNDKIDFVFNAKTKKK